MIRKFIKYFIKTPSVQLGRWKLKHNCHTEELVVYNTNRDHCGDTICGKPLQGPLTNEKTRDRSDSEVPRKS